MTSEVFQTKVGRCVPVVVQTFCFIYRELERCRVKNVQQSWLWSCGAIGRKLHYYLSLAFGHLRHSDVSFTLVV